MHDKAFNVSRMQNMMDINMELLQCFYKSFDKKISDEAIKNENMSRKELAEELHKPIIRKFNKKVTLIVYRWYLLWFCSCWYAINK